MYFCFLFLGSGSVLGWGYADEVILLAGLAIYSLISVFPTNFSRGLLISADFTGFIGSSCIFYMSFTYICGDGCIGGAEMLGLAISNFGMGASRDERVITGGTIGAEGGTIF